MTVTIELSQEMEREAIEFAEAHGETVANLAGRLLTAYLEEMRQQSDDARAVDAALARIASSEAQWEEWDEVKAELDALPD